MHHRKSLAALCPRCLYVVACCVCTRAVPIATETDVHLVLHLREAQKASSSGPGCCAALAKGSVHLHGLRDQPLDLSPLSATGRRVVVLFPGDGAVPLEHLLAGEDVRPLTLVVPDGNWSQARRIALRVQGLEGLPRAYLSAVGESGAALPDAAPPELSTGEAIARALGMIESAAVEHALRAWRLSLVPSEVQAGAAHQADGGERAPSASFAADPLEVLYEDEDFVAVHKPAGMLVHRGWGNDGVPALQVLRDQLGKRVFPVHRLDRATSGVLLFAFSPELARDTQLLFQAGKVRKVYLALTRGNQIVEGSIEHPLALRAGSSPKPACTHLRRLGVFERYGLYEAEPLTGRTHQIRKHLKHVSHPLIGDVRYGKGEHNRVFRERFGFHRLALHCRELSFPHPRRAEQVQLLAQPRGDFARLLAQLGLDGRLSLRAEPESS